MAVKIFSKCEGENFAGLEDRVNDFLIEFEKRNIPTQVTVTNNDVIYVFHPTVSLYEEHVKNMQQQQLNNPIKRKDWQ